MKQANFKNVKVGQRFISLHGLFAKIRPCSIKGEMKNAVLVEDGLKGTNANPLPTGYWNFGNVAVSILEDDEG